MITLNKTYKSNTTTTFSNSSEIAMTINENALGHIMERLTDLYANPVMSVIRELTSNAIDATIQAGKNTPVKIILSESEETLSIIDSGIGMSYKDIVEIYSQYGASTKTTDLNTIGAYGIGGKSPLAYTDSFIIESTKDGKKVQAIVSKSDNGPVIQIVSEEDTTDENGTTISIPIAEGDYDYFRENLTEYYYVPKESYTIPVEIIEKDKTTGYSPLAMGKRDSENSRYIKIPLNIDGITVNSYFTTKSLFDLFYLQHTNEDYKLSPRLRYVLEGYTYNIPYEKNNYSRVLTHTNNKIFIQLVPGLVDFNSSREEISDNNKYKNFESKLFDKILNIDVAKEITNNFKDEDFTSEFHHYAFTAEEKMPNVIGEINGVNYTQLIKDLKEVIVIGGDQKTSLAVILSAEVSLFEAMFKRYNFSTPLNHYLGKTSFITIINETAVVSEYSDKIIKNQRYLLANKAPYIFYVVDFKGKEQEVKLVLSLLRSKNRYNSFCYLTPQDIKEERKVKRETKKKKEIVPEVTTLKYCFDYGLRTDEKINFQKGDFSKTHLIFSPSYININLDGYIKDNFIKILLTKKKDEKVVFINAYKQTDLALKLKKLQKNKTVKYVWQIDDSRDFTSGVKRELEALNIQIPQESLLDKISLTKKEFLSIIVNSPQFDGNGNLFIAQIDKSIKKQNSLDIDDLVNIEKVRKLLEKGNLYNIYKDYKVVFNQFYYYSYNHEIGKSELAFRSQNFFQKIDKQALEEYKELGKKITDNKFNEWKEAFMKVYESCAD